VAVKRCGDVVEAPGAVAGAGDQDIRGHISSVGETVV
jgi:hypothetical protein